MNEMNLLTKMDDVLQFIEWQQSEDRIVEIKLHGDEVSFSLEDQETKEKEVVRSFKEVTIATQPKNRMRKRDVNKFVSKVNGSLYPFVAWMEKGDRGVVFRLAEDVTIDVFDFELMVGQRVHFVEQIDLYSEKILALMKQCIPLADTDPVRKEYLQQIAQLEMKKTQLSMQKETH